MSEPVDQTEAELEKTRRVVAASMAEQIAVNDAAAHDDAAVEEDADLGEMTKAELLELATERDIVGRYEMNKAELLEALEGT
jgi:hypothetical protein